MGHGMVPKRVTDGQSNRNDFVPLFSQSLLSCCGAVHRRVVDGALPEPEGSSGQGSFKCVSLRSLTNLNIYLLLLFSVYFVSAN